MSDRILKVNEKIRHDLGLIFERELSLKKGVLLTITRVDTTRDLRYTRVFVSVYPEKDTAYALRTIEKEKHRLERVLHKFLIMKIKPHISFILDPTEVAAEEVEQIFKRIADERSLIQ